jgi:DNA-binding NarL/FixJ family response regulator
MIKVVIVDDQKVVTQGLKALLESEPDIQIIGTGSNGQEAIDLVMELNPDVLLIDQFMPVMDGVAATRIICSRFANVAVLLLSGSDPDDTIADALNAGAKGYLLKNTSAEDLANSIRSLYRGYSQMGPGLIEKFLARVNSTTLSSPTAVPSSVHLAQSTDSVLSQLLSTPTQFDGEAMTALLDAVDGPTDAAALMTQIERKLQKYPHHVSALYLAGRLIGSFQQHSRLSMNYFRLAYQNSQAQSFSVTVRLQIAQAAWNVNSSEVLGWLKEMLKTWPPKSPQSKFFENLALVFSESSAAYRLLKATWEIQHIRGLCDQADTLKSKLSPFNRENEQWFVNESQMSAR